VTPLLALIAFYLDSAIRQHFILLNRMSVLRAEEVSFVDRKKTRKAETENKKQIGHFTLTFLIKVKAEGTSLLCQLY
jgi:hypothetical protein